ncbi:transposase [Catalinimonas sp. 4WD22]|uniref:transposase n=1 Tax=Catalinimonas locisalis TaxID=3133978 RepID=UPI0031010E97
MIDSLKYCQQHKGLEIYAYVIMPSHVHMIVRQSEAKLDKVIGEFKGFTAKEILRMIAESPQQSHKKWLLHMFAYAAKYHMQHAEYMVWQYTKHPIELSNAKLFQQKTDYIHQNPLTAGYIKEAEKWYYSSANPYSPIHLKES